MNFDDSDIKIFNDSNKNSDSIDEVSIIAEMTKLRSNGNIDRAKKLGKHLANIFVDEPQLLHMLEGEVGQLNFDGDTMYQIKVLLVFTAEYCINHSLHALLANTAVNAMYETVSSKAFEFYDRLDDAAEYSFYYLAVRKGVDIPANIGISFAMLCGKEKDGYFTELGTKLFEVTKNEIENIIDLYEFKN